MFMVLHILISGLNKLRVQKINICALKTNNCACCKIAGALMYSYTMQLKYICEYSQNTKYVCNT